MRPRIRFPETRPLDPAEYASKHLVSLDTRWLSTDMIQEIVLLADHAWTIWSSDDGEILMARKGPTA